MKRWYFKLLLAVACLLVLMSCVEALVSFIADISRKVFGESLMNPSFFAIIDDEAARDLLNKLAIVARQYSWLLDVFMVDFFLDKLYSRIPCCWQSLFATVRIEDLSFLLSPSARSNGMRVWPLSLLALRSVAFTYSLRRYPLVSVDALCPLSVGQRNIRLPRDRLEHISPKKMHQIEILGALISRFFTRLNILTSGVVVDAGSGKGHLSRLLHEVYGLQVIAIDADNAVVRKSCEIDLRRTARNFAEQPPVVHLVQRLSKQGWLDSLSINEPLVLVGLHACGYLSEHLIHEFAASGNCRLLFSVGCCYMRLAPKQQVWEPISRHLQSANAGASFGYAALDCACHSVEKMLAKLSCLDGRASLVVHCYRAALEWVLVHRCNFSRRSRLCRVRQAHLLTFVEYARKATKNLDLNINYSEFDSDNTVGWMLKQWLQVAFFFALRCLLSPVVESIILLDRALFLREHNVDVILAPVFDPLICARNLLLVGFKADPSASVPWKGPY